jgi:hypothetical protein
MTRSWIAMASRTLRMARTESARSRRQRTSPSLENLEHRLSLSSYSAGMVLGTQLNPQPLPPDRYPTHAVVVELKKEI